MGITTENIISYGFKEIHLKYFKKEEVSGKLGYWTTAILDFRWYNNPRSLYEISIFGVRGDEKEYLFRGIIKTKDELETILKQTQILDYE